MRTLIALALMTVPTFADDLKIGDCDHIPKYTIRGFKCRSTVAYSISHARAAERLKAKHAEERRVVDETRRQFDRDFK